LFGEEEHGLPALMDEVALATNRVDFRGWEFLELSNAEFVHAGSQLA